MIPLPITLAPADRDAVPHTYVIHKYSQHCRCGSLHEFSKLYGKTHFKARMGHKYITNLRPIRAPEEITYNLPIEIVTIPPERLLFCHECISSQTLAHLPPAPAMKPTAIVGTTNFADKKPATKAKTPFTVDDL